MLTRYSICYTRCISNKAQWIINCQLHSPDRLLYYDTCTVQGLKTQTWPLTRPSWSKVRLCLKLVFFSVLFSLRAKEKRLRREKKREERSEEGGKIGKRNLSGFGVLMGFDGCGFRFWRVWIWGFERDLGWEAEENNSFVFFFQEECFIQSNLRRLPADT